jgi:hypothetical protein
MKKTLLILSTVALLFVIFIGVRIGIARTHHINTDIFRYKGSYIGNNSAVGNIAYHLPQSKVFKQFTLETQKKPYGMTLEYGDATGVIKNNVITTATYMFTLIKNAEWVTIVYPYGKYTLTREQLQQWYGKDLSEIINEKDLINLIQTNLKDKNKVNQL